MRGAVVEAAGGEGRGSLGPQGHWVKERKRRQQPGAVGKCVLPHRACKYRCRPWGSGQDQCGGRRRRTDRDMWPPSRRDNQCHRPSARVSASSAVLPASLHLRPLAIPLLLLRLPLQAWTIQSRRYKQRVSALASSLKMNSRLPRPGATNSGRLHTLGAYIGPSPSYTHVLPLFAHDSV